MDYAYMETPDDFPVSRAEIRAMIMDQLRGPAERGMPPSIHMQNIVQALVISPREPREGQRVPVAQRDILRSMVAEVGHDLCRRGATRPSYGTPNALTITEQGLAACHAGALDSVEWLDADAYVEKVRQEAGGILDDVVAMYLREAKRAYDDGLLLSCAVTLGCASEQAVHCLINAVVEYEATRAFAEQFPPERSISAQFGVLTAKLCDREFKRRVKADMPADPPDGAMGLLDEPHRVRVLFDIYRVHRNEAAHPSGQIPTRQELLAYLESFGVYAKMVFGFIGLLEAIRSQPTR
jgi:hypothetical protein